MLAGIGCRLQECMCTVHMAVRKGGSGACSGDASEGAVNWCIAVSIQWL